MPDAGKSAEEVAPVTYELPLASTAIPVAASEFVPPIYVEKMNAEP